jgi:adenylylsulfate kinase-like enzyme
MQKILMIFCKKSFMPKRVHLTASIFNSDCHIVIASLASLYEEKRRN